jgi:DNA-binding NarL/FixJ family response regulator
MPASASHSSVSGRRVRIGMVEDNAVLRAGMRQVVARRADWEWVWEADTFAAAAAGPAANCDLVLLDLGLPDGNGLDLIAGLRQRTGSHVLVFSVLGDEASVLRAIELGAAGYLLKESAATEIIEAIDNVLAGGAPLTPSVAAHLLRRLRQPVVNVAAATTGVAAAAPIDMLTARERDVLLALARGYSYDEAAELLGISRHTVGHHVKHIYSKLAVNSKSEAVFEAMQAGWLGRHES